MIYATSTTKRGFIALTSVLVLGALFLSLIAGLAYRSLNSVSDSIALNAANNAAILADACVEYALMELTREYVYGGDETLVIADGTCTIFPIEAKESGAYTIHAQGEISDHIYRVIVEVASREPEVQLSSYLPVSEF